MTDLDAYDGVPAPPYFNGVITKHGDGISLAIHPSGDTYRVLVEGRESISLELLGVVWSFELIQQIGSTLDVRPVSRLGGDVSRPRRGAVGDLTGGSSWGDQLRGPGRPRWETPGDPG